MGRVKRRKHTVIDDSIAVVEGDAMVAIGEDVDVIVFYAGKIQFVEEGERVLEVYIWRRYC